MNVRRQFLSEKKDFYEKAKKHLTEALQRYRSLNNEEKITATEEELKKVAANSPKIRRLSKQSDDVLDFAISVDKEIIERFSVSVDGEVKWHSPITPSKSFAIGLVNIWQVVCTNYPYYFF